MVDNKTGARPADQPIEMVEPDVDKLALSVIAAKARAYKENPGKPECWLKDEAMMAQARLIWRLAHAVWLVGNMDTEHDKTQWWRDFDSVWNEAAGIMLFNPPVAKPDAQTPSGDPQ